MYESVKRKYKDSIAGLTSEIGTSSEVSTAVLSEL